MEEELREQPTMEPATALNKAQENSVESEVGSQNGELGKFKNSQALLEAYNNLQAEFTRKCQLLSKLQQDKMQENGSDEADKENRPVEDQSFDNLQVEEKQSIDEKQNEIDKKDEQSDFEKSFDAFLEANSEAVEFADEIKSRFHQAKTNSSPFEDAWAKVVFSQLKEGKLSDNMIDQYLLTDEHLKQRVIENYLKNLQNNKPPLVISTSGERLSKITVDSPKTLAQAKAMVDKMFS